MASGLYNKFKEAQLNGSNVVDFDTDTVKVMLTSSSYTPDLDAHDFASDISNEVSVSGYASGGQTLTSKTVTLDTANDRVDVDAADVVWSIPSGSTLTARYAVIYKAVGTTMTVSPLIALIDFAGDQVASNGALTISWSAAGYLRLS